MEKYQFTNRVNRIFHIARKEAECSDHIIQPLHLFIGACKEGTGVCSELYMYLFHHVGIDFLTKLSKLNTLCSEDESYVEINGYKVSSKTVEILKIAYRKMECFNQVYINEGHILSTILQQDEGIQSLLEVNVRQGILNIVSVPRDMTVNLIGYEKADMNDSNVFMRRATVDDFKELIQFVQLEFGERWIDSVKTGFQSHLEIPIYLAVKNEKIIGFACYDVVRGKKGLFGPMGTSKENRVQGVGAALLHHCLYDMKRIGYEYAIIGQAGPVEFYERMCNARLIPII
ncbi:GNAT family N-acetyltransferase [Bacillus sp. DX1.1]|uniref:GNAT family N-acetyltransferase n=1 Tax=unclassified Bacillus (in: firmicutes) TaxID=185979 RepID=UPI002570DE51|nr:MULTISPECIES: GNAT family N-acetyltransferase [unclassified Bacillus (in: firmicutes)]MDM5154390.1 GNAT family N-acetyltransferase [Bacillus sp. DX1.1]WJE83296.1 GNAT family N-acetyltransferase [Bacillus sp. DX3.1]